MFVVAFFVLWIGGISVRLVHLQVNQHEWLKGRATAARTDIKKEQMLRGSIIDRNNRTLAISLRVRTLYANPMEIEDLDGTVKALAGNLKINSKELLTQLKEAKEAGKRYVLVAKKLDDEIFLKLNKALDDPAVRKADLPNHAGLHWQDEQERNYPYETLAAQVIGFSNSEDSGKAGIEKSQDEVLRGAIIKTRQERDRLGRVYEETSNEREAPGDVVLTVDTTLQFISERALETGVREAGAKGGTVIVMDPAAGDILAMANYPTFDPNMLLEATSQHRQNRAIEATYTPGSVFKAITYGSALEKKLISPDDMVDSGNGTIEVAKHKFTDSHAVGTVSYSQAMAHSSNVCAIKTSMRVGREDFFALVKKMGFGAKTGVELPAETAGLLRPLERWAGDSLASMSIGYEIGVTPLQMTSAFATIANNGIRVQPHIIKEIRPSNDQPRSVTQAEKTEVLSHASAQSLRKMLRQVVLTGTGRRAQLNGYTSAGKTGTAWKVDTARKTVDSSRYVSSFIGMAPADDPRIVIAVIMDEPKSGARDGGTVAAPVFQAIAQQILEEMKVPHDAPLSGPREVIASDTIPKEDPAAGLTESPADRSAKSADSVESQKPKPVPPTKRPEAEPKEKPKTNDTKKLVAAGGSLERRTRPPRSKIET
jgi:cell division protein FtsI (penicillin-binding protein 3)